MAHHLHKIMAHHRISTDFHLLGDIHLLALETMGFQYPRHLEGHHKMDPPQTGFTTSPHLSVDPLEMGAEGATMVATTEAAITMVATGEDTIEVVIEMAEVLKEEISTIIEISGNYLKIMSIIF